MRPVTTGEMDLILTAWTEWFKRELKWVELDILERLIEGAKADREAVGRLDQLVTTLQESEEAWRARIKGLVEQSDRLMESNKTAAAKATYASEAVRRAMDLLRDINP